MAMRYEYERISLKNNPFYQARSEDDEHRRVIDGRAARGQRFVAMIPVLEGANGKTLEYDLVFEVTEGAGAAENPAGNSDSAGPACSAGSAFSAGSAGRAGTSR